MKILKRLIFWKKDKANDAKKAEAEVTDKAENKKSFFKSISEKSQDSFTEKYPGKKQLLIFKLLKFAGGFLFIFMLGVSFFFSSENESSFYRLTRLTSLGESKESSDSINLGTKKQKKVKGVNYGQKTSHESKKVGTANQRRALKIKFKAPQVIVRRDEATSKALPTGASSIGKLLTNIDTRLASGKLIRVLLTNGINFNGRTVLPKRTILLGQSAYPSRGKRVFINFSLAVLPNGKEVQLQASALDYKDFTPGVIGRYHSSFKNRVAATAGLSFLTGFSETLQEREVLGQDLSVQGINPGFNGMPQVTKKATLKNAMLSGLSEFSKTEGSLQLQELQNKGPYVKVRAGKPIIITLNQRLTLEKK